jgi:hypothetical protein
MIKVTHAHAAVLQQGRSWYVPHGAAVLFSTTKFHLENHLTSNKKGLLMVLTN